MQELNQLVGAAKLGALDEVESIVRDHPEIISLRDEEGATPLHYAALAGHRQVVEFLVQHGANINATDARYGATPAGWAIEYLREMGAFLGIELSDLVFAIDRRDVEWVRRFVERFPALRRATDTQGRSFRQLAEQSGSEEIRLLFQRESTR